jgi:hypothetical protein
MNDGIILADGWLDVNAWCQQVKEHGYPAVLL